MAVSAARAMFEQGGAQSEASQPPRPPGSPPQTAAGAGVGGADVQVFTLSLDENTKRPRAVSCLAVNRDGTLVAYSPNNHEVHIAEFTGSSFNDIAVLKEHDQLVTSMDWAHNSDRIVTCSQDRNAYVWDGDRAKGWKPTLVHLRIHRAATYVRWCHNEKKFAVASGQKSVAVCYYEEENNWWISKLIEGVFESTVLTVAWHKSDIVLAAGSSDGSVRLFAAAVKGVDSKPSQIFGPDVSFKKMGSEIATIRANAWVQDMAFSPTSDVLAFATHDSCVSFLPIVEGTPPTQVCSRRSFLLRSAALSAREHARGNCICACSRDATRCRRMLVTSSDDKSESRSAGKLDLPLRRAPDALRWRVAHEERQGLGPTV